MSSSTSSAPQSAPFTAVTTNPLRCMRVRDNDGTRPGQQCNHIFANVSSFNTHVHDFHTEEGRAKRLALAARMHAGTDTAAAAAVQRGELTRAEALLTPEFRLPEFQLVALSSLKPAVAALIEEWRLCAVGGVVYVIYHRTSKLGRDIANHISTLQREFPLAGNRVFTDDGIGCRGDRVMIQAVLLHQAGLALSDDDELTLCICIAQFNRLGRYFDEDGG